MQIWILFALLTPIFWGFCNVLDGGLRRNFVKDDFVLATILFGLRLFFILPLLFFIELKFDVYSLALFVIGFLEIFSFLLYFKALEKEETSRVVLLMQLLPVVSLFLAYLILNEILNVSQFIAFLVILFGSFLASVKKTRNVWHFSPALVAILVAVVCWSFIDVLFKFFAESEGSFMEAFFWIFAGNAFSFFWIFFSREKFLKARSAVKNLNKKGWIFVLMSVFSGTVGNLFFNYALIIGKVSLVSVISGVQPFFALIFGVILARFFIEIPKENFSKENLFLKIVSILLTFIGLLYLNF